MSCKKAPIYTRKRTFLKSCCFFLISLCLIINLAHGFNSPFLDIEITISGKWQNRQKINFSGIGEFEAIVFNMEVTFGQGLSLRSQYNFFYLKGILKAGARRVICLNPCFWRKSDLCLILVCLVSLWFRKNRCLLTCRVRDEPRI